MGRRGTPWDAVAAATFPDISWLTAPWSFVESLGGAPRSSVEARGGPWKPVEARGSPWKPVEACGSPVELRGALWLPCVELRGAIVVLAGIAICKDHHDSKTSMMQRSILTRLDSIRALGSFREIEILTLSYL